MSGTRPDLDEVRRSYQVADDEVITYRPRVYGAIEIPFTDGRQMTRAEGELLDRLTRDRGLLGLSAFRDIARDAFAEAERRYPDNTVPADVPANRAREWQGNDGHRDAFRHAYWSARLAQEYGPAWARAFTTAHEGLPGNWANREAMDLYNNGIGVRIGAAHRDASPERIAELVRQAVDRGELVVIDRNGQMEWSDRVGLGQHGLSREDVIGPQLRTPGAVSTDTRSTAGLAPSPEHGDGARLAQGDGTSRDAIERLSTSVGGGQAEFDAALRALRESEAGRRFEEQVAANRSAMREREASPEAERGEQAIVRG